MKRAVPIVVFLVVAFAYVAGCWPQQRRLNDTRAQLEATQSQLAAAEARIRLAEVLGHLFGLSDAVAARNFGEAASVSSAFFDRVRLEASRADKADVTAALEAILNTRDQVTTAIARAEASVSALLKDHERALRTALGFPVAAPG